MQMCPFCEMVYDESEYSKCPYCSKDDNVIYFDYDEDDDE